LTNDDDFTVGGGLLLYQGTVDDVRLYEEPLNEDQVNQIYGANAP